MRCRVLVAHRVAQCRVARRRGPTTTSTLTRTLSTTLALTLTLSLTLTLTLTLTPTLSKPKVLLLARTRMMALERRIQATG